MSDSDPYSDPFFSTPQHHHPPQDYSSQDYSSQDYSSQDFFLQDYSSQTLSSASTASQRPIPQQQLGRQYSDYSSPSSRSSFYATPQTHNAPSALNSFSSASASSPGALHPPRSHFLQQVLNATASSRSPRRTSPRTPRRSPGPAAPSSGNPFFRHRRPGADFFDLTGDSSLGVPSSPPAMPPAGRPPKRVVTIDDDDDDDSDDVHVVAGSSSRHPAAGAASSSSTATATAVPPAETLKRTKLNDGTWTAAGGPAAAGGVESVDLAGDEGRAPTPSLPLEEALRRQRVEQVRGQEPEKDKPLRLSNITCVICMDRPKDITATSCGHIFCHACLMEALIAGENRANPGEPRRSQCPVCRKAIARNRERDTIALLMMKDRAGAGAAARQRGLGGRIGGGGGGGGVGGASGKTWAGA